MFTIVPTIDTPAGPMSMKFPPTLKLNCVRASSTSVVPALK